MQQVTSLKSLNPRIADMAEKDCLYHEAGLNLFGEGFCRKAKERDEELKALNNLGATNFGEARKNPGCPPPPLWQDFRNGMQGQRFNSGRARPRFGPYQPATTSKRNQSPK